MTLIKQLLSEQKFEQPNNGHVCEHCGSKDVEFTDEKKTITGAYIKYKDCGKLTHVQ